MTSPPNAPGCRYPIPPRGSQDWVSLVAMFKGMEAEAQSRANEIRAIDCPEEDVRRAKAESTAAAYGFAACMIQIQLDSP